MNRGSIFIVSAPSGAGKTTLCRMITERLKGIEHSISYTTRAPRPGEVNGRDYYFVDREEFMRMVEGGEFIEWAEVHGNLYGTSKRRLMERIEQGMDVILDIDTQGARQIRQQALEATFIFIMPPSMEVLKQRLLNRGSDSEDVIKKRLKNALDEIADYKHYDYVIINDILEDAFDELKAVILSRRVSISKVDHQWIKEQFLNTESLREY